MIELLAVVPALFGLYLWGADFQYYSVWSVGVYKRVHRYRATDQTAACTATDCESGVLEGEIRKARKELVVAGFPVFYYDSVTNRYCPEHTSFEYRQGEYGQTWTVKTTQTIMGAIERFCALKTTVAVDTDDTSEIDHVTDDLSGTVGSSFNLLGVAFLVAFAAVCIGIVNGLGGNR
jgi:hypothetical protein